MEIRDLSACRDLDLDATVSFKDGYPTEDGNASDATMTPLSSATMSLATMSPLSSLDEVQMESCLDHSRTVNRKLSSLRKVQFRSHDSLIDDFTPYGDIYGVHPRFFEFDARGYMVQPSKEDLEELLSVELGNLLECIAPRGVSYRSKPNCSSDVEDGEDMERLEEGDQLEVLQRRGEWVRDSVGWFPLVVDGVAVFAVRYL